MVEVIPPADYPVIVAGSTWIWRQWAHDDETGQPFNWREDSGRWLVEAEIRDRSGQLLTRLASSGARDGMIQLHGDGELTFILDASVTAELPITRPYTNSTDVRIAGRRHRGAHAFDVIATDTWADPVEAIALVSGFVTVQQLVTA